MPTVGSLVLGAIVLAGIHTAASGQSQSGAAIAGVVYGDDEHPISGALVTLSELDGAKRPATTGLDGRFRFVALAPGRYRVDIQKQGWLPASYGRFKPHGDAAWIDVSPDDRVEDVIVRLTRYASIDGLVTSDSDRSEGIARTRVLALVRSFGSLTRNWAVFASTVTDVKGRFRFGDLPPNTYAILALPSGVVGAAYRPTFAGNVSDPSLSSVALSSGQHIAGLEMRLRPVTQSTLNVTVTGHSPLRPVEIELSPLELAAVHTDLSTLRATADAKGRVFFRSIPAGEYQLRCRQRPPLTTDREREYLAPSPIPLLWADLRVSVPSGTTFDANVVLRDGLRISGVLQFEGAQQRPNAGAVEGAFLRLEPSDGSSLGDVLVTTDDQYRFTSLPRITPGSYLLRSPAIAGWRLQSAIWRNKNIAENSVQIDEDVAGVVLTYTDNKTAALSGRVTDLSMGGLRPWEVAVVLLPTDRDLWRNFGYRSQRMAKISPRRDGTFHFSNFPSGEYFLVAVPEQAVDGQFDDVDLLGRIVGLATRVRLLDGQTATVNLSTSFVR